MRLILAILTASVAYGEGPVAHWSFDSDPRTVANGSAGRSESIITGFCKQAQGVRGLALSFDGFTTRVGHSAGALHDALAIEKGFTVEAWIAPQEYSWNWTGIVDQEEDHKNGFSFGIDFLGRVGLQMAGGDQWHTVLSEKSVPLLEWTHVAAVYDPLRGMTVYINGQPAGQKTIEGRPTPSNADIWIGMSHTQQWPKLTEREISKTPSPMVFDGLIDEVKIYARAFDAQVVRAAFNAVAPENAKPLEYRRMPSGPKGPGPFGAFYTKLEYCEAWDRRWRVSEHPDIVVRFDASPTKIVFWRGTGYMAAWVTENDRWVSDQGPEMLNNGCYEHMSDKQCRFSHVRILENSPARAVVHWRTALPNVNYEPTNIDQDTGWWPWADEYYYIYPDGVCVRYQRAWGPNIWEFQQSEILCQPGTRPQDNVEVEAITVMDLNGNTNAYSWKKPYGERLETETQIDGPIQIINLRSNHRHYVVGESDAKFAPFLFGAREGHSNFPNWNHWPVAQLPNDGRVAPAPDRPSSACCGTLNPVRRQGDDGITWVRNLYGLTNKGQAHIAALARSWNHAPRLMLQGTSFKSQGYDKNQRAYVVARENEGPPGDLLFDLEASEHSPISNLALIVKDWGDGDVRMKIDGLLVPQGDDFRVGHLRTLDGVDLVVWLVLDSTKPVRFNLEKRRL